MIFPLISRSPECFVTNIRMCIRIQQLQLYVSPFYFGQDCAVPQANCCLCKTRPKPKGQVGVRVQVRQKPSCTKSLILHARVCSSQALVVLMGDRGTRQGVERVLLLQLYPPILQNKPRRQSPGWQTWDECIYQIQKRIMWMFVFEHAWARWDSFIIPSLIIFFSSKGYC